MPVLLKSVKGEILDNFIGEIKLLSISASVQFEDYINMNGFIAYLQNYRQVSTIENLVKPQIYGLKNQNNQKEIILQISY